MMRNYTLIVAAILLCPLNNTYAQEKVQIDEVLNERHAQSRLLEGSEALAAATALFLSIEKGEVQRSGYENRVRQYATGFEIPEADATDILNLILDANTEHDAMRHEAKVANCIDFLEDLTTVPDLAASRMADAEGHANGLIVEYLQGIYEEMELSFPTNVYTATSERILNFATNLRTVDTTSIEALREAGHDPTEFYINHCGLIVSR